MRDQSPLVKASIRTLFATLAALVLLVPAATAQLVEGDVKDLLRELGVQLPARSIDARPFSLPDLNGKPLRLADHLGRVVVLYFWTSY